MLCPLDAQKLVSREARSSQSIWRELLSLLASSRSPRPMYFMYLMGRGQGVRGGIVYRPRPIIDLSLLCPLDAPKVGFTRSCRARKAFGELCSPYESSRSSRPMYFMGRGLGVRGGVLSTSPNHRPRRKLMSHKGARTGARIGRHRKRSGPHFTFRVHFSSTKSLASCGSGFLREPWLLPCG